MCPASDPGPHEAPGGSYDEMRVAFTAAVSHELRTPLARLLALLESAALAGPDLPDLIEQGRREVEEMRDLIDEMLFLAELDSGREVVSLGETTVLATLLHVAEEMRPKAERYGVTLRFSGDPELSVAVRRRMLAMLARNLTDNAIRYAGHGATFTLVVLREGDSVVLRASDDGPGVPPAHLSRLFERFYRVDPARSLPGSGLGLAIVKHIVTAAGGSIAAAAAREGGLEIRCAFPLRRRGQRSLASGSIL
jgi:two-component system phosphate regulon sensor histidine kinase PhoR